MLTQFSQMIIIHAESQRMGVAPSISPKGGVLFNQQFENVRSPAKKDLTFFLCENAEKSSPLGFLSPDNGLFSPDNGGARGGVKTIETEGGVKTIELEGATPRTRTRSRVHLCVVHKRGRCEYIFSAHSATLREINILAKL